MPDVPHTPADSDDEEFPPLVGGPRNPKLERWVDLLAALLARSTPATFDELTTAVPAYCAKARDRDAAADDATRKRLNESLKRSFERDKDDLRTLGIAIESLPDEDGNVGGAYRLRRTDFYLPYLCLAIPGGGAMSPRRIDQYGYKSLASLVLEPDELEVIVDAAATVRALGDPQLRADVDSAMRKLAIDLPVDAGSASPDVPRVVTTRTPPDAAVFAQLGQALRSHKIVTFTYSVLLSGEAEQRVVEPYGLFFLSGHWYLAGRDEGRGQMRNFRLNRIGDVVVNGKSPQSPDYHVPASFSLREHARSRQPWELGDGDALRVLVDFRGDSGATLAAAALGAEVAAQPTQREFMVRRTDSFARWVLSFGGEAVIVSPAALVEQVRSLADATADVYARDASDDRPTPSARAVSATPARVSWEPRGAAAQFKRILLAVPQIADGEEHNLADVAARVGTDIATLQQDLHSLVERYDLPAGFVEGVQIFLEPDRVSARSNHLRRPMRLTVSELCALDLGLAVLRAQRPPDEHAVLDRARARLQAIIARLPNDPIPDSLYNASFGDFGSTTHLPIIRNGLRSHTKLQLGYRKSGSSATDQRVVCPYALVAASGMLYLIAWCDRSDGIRVFRLDRVLHAEGTTMAFDLPDSFSVDSIVRDGRVFQSEPPETMLVRYSPRIAPWIAEREGRALEEDGSLVLEHPLADWQWGVRHVLQYGAEAEVLQPPSLRERLRDCLDGMRRPTS